MAKNKCVTLYDGLVSFVNTYGREDVKIALGDSIDNNRTLTVSQVVRFLTTRRNNKLRSLGVNLEIAYDLLRSDIISNRLNHRTDAVDINEFLVFFEMYVINVKSEVRTLSRELTTINL